MIASDLRQLFNETHACVIFPIHWWLLHLLCFSADTA